VAWTTERNKLDQIFPTQSVDGDAGTWSPHMPDRRGERKTLFRVGALTTNDTRELCVVRTVSPTAMTIKVFSALHAGDRVAIEFKHGEPIDGTVSTVDGCSAEVRFDRPVDVAAIVAAAPDGPRPRMPRIEIDCVATVREGANQYRVRASDISQGGIRVESDAPLPERAHVVVSIGGMEPEQAVVTWRRGRLTGLSFNRLLSIRQLVDWLHEHKKLGQHPA
jgi:hypothetical protein